MIIERWDTEDGDILTALNKRTQTHTNAWSTDILCTRNAHFALRPLNRTRNADIETLISHTRTALVKLAKLQAALAWSSDIFTLYRHTSPIQGFIASHGRACEARVKCLSRKCCRDLFDCDNGLNLARRHQSVVDSKKRMWTMVAGLLP